jgi:hypothetical protein
VSYRVVGDVSPGEECYVDLKAWGYDYFAALELPVTNKTYVVRCNYLRWNDAGHKRIVLGSQIFASVFSWDAFSVFAYGMEKLFDDNVMVLVDEEFCVHYPLVLG